MDSTKLMNSSPMTIGGLGILATRQVIRTIMRTMPTYQSPPRETAQSPLSTRTSNHSPGTHPDQSHWSIIQSNGFNAILVIIDRFPLLKMIIPAATTMELTSIKTTEIYFHDQHLEQAWASQKKVISDQGSQFGYTIHVGSLHKLCRHTSQEILSTTYHPQTDSQRMNQEINFTYSLIIVRMTGRTGLTLPWNSPITTKVHTSTDSLPFFRQLRHHPDKGTSTRKEVKSQSAIEFTAVNVKKYGKKPNALSASLLEQTKKFADRKRGDSHESTIWETKSRLEATAISLPTDLPRSLTTSAVAPSEHRQEELDGPLTSFDLSRTWHALPGPFSTKYAPHSLYFSLFFLSAEKYSLPDSRHH